MRSNLFRPKTFSIWVIVIAFITMTLNLGGCTHPGKLAPKSIKGKTLHLRFDIATGIFADEQGLDRYIHFYPNNLFEAKTEAGVVDFKGHYQYYRRSNKSADVTLIITSEGPKEKVLKMRHVFQDKEHGVFEGKFVSGGNGTVAGRFNFTRGNLFR